MFIVKLSGIQYGMEKCNKLNVPQNSTYLFHMMKFKHYQLVIKTILPHYYIHKLLLAIRTHSQHILNNNSKKSYSKLVKDCLKVKTEKKHSIGMLT